MGGKLLETESERLLRIGREEGMERGLEEGLERGMEKGLEEGLEKGMEKGMERGMRSLVETCQEVGLSIADAVEKLISKFGLSESASLAKVNQYWQK